MEDNTQKTLTCIYIYIYVCIFPWVIYLQKISSRRLNQDEYIIFPLAIQFQDVLKMF